MFLTSLTTVGIMLLYAIPGYILVKTGIVKDHGIPGFAALLMYVCQPCLTLYAFQKIEVFSWDIVIGMAITFGLSLGIMCLVILIGFLIMRKFYSDARFRVANLAIAFGNFTFIGMPLLEALLPEYTEGAIYSNIFFVSMSLLGWTLGSALLAGSVKACKPLKILLNPATLTLVVALPLFFCSVHIVEPLLDAITIMGRASTPLCMIVLGMRLGASTLKEVFAGWTQYAAAAIKQIIVPLFALLILYWLPFIDQNMKILFYILNCCPVAAVVLTFSEIFGHGQKYAANTVLVSTISSIVTMPLMLLIVQAIFGL